MLKITITKRKNPMSELFPMFESRQPPRPYPAEANISTQYQLIDDNDDINCYERNWKSNAIEEFRGEEHGHAISSCFPPT